MSLPPGAARNLRALAPRPDLWPIALVALLRMAPCGWWRRWPPLPSPDPDYWRFRMTTVYGGAGHRAPTPADLVEYLEWCRVRWRRGERLLR